MDATCCGRQTAVFYRSASDTTIWSEEAHKKPRNLPVCSTGAHPGNETSQPCPVLLELFVSGCGENIWASSKWGSGKE